MPYDNTNRGTLGRNKKPNSDRSPEYTGKLNVDGKDYWLNAWLKTSSKDGSKFFSLSVKPVDEQQQAEGRGQSNYSEGPEQGVPF